MMTKEQAIEAITQAVNAATLKGVYTLKDVSLILQALNKVSELVEIVPDSK
jgi:hypothetical protein